MSKLLFRSPSGNLIMTKLPRAVKIWTQDGVCRKTIERDCPVQSVAWLPHGEGEQAMEVPGGRLTSLVCVPSILICRGEQNRSSGALICMMIPFYF